MYTLSDVMAKPYLTDLTALIAGVCDPAVVSSITTKHFFSGAAAYVDGRIFMSLSPEGLALKLPESERAALFEQGGKPLRYFPKAPIKKGYVVLPDQIVADEIVLREFIYRSLSYAKSI